VNLPDKLIDSLKELPGFDRQAFTNVHLSGEQITSIRLNPAKPVPQLNDLSSESRTRIPWTDNGYYLKERPSFTFDPLFHAGCYYVQEASSMFIEQALKQTMDLSKPLKILDLCAAPGGKSTHIQSLISRESLLVSNEVIRARANILKDNIIKWGSDNIVVTNNDPAHFTGLENYFDVIVIDAPCSGSGLFRREPEAIEEWSEASVQLCSQRQQRIIADVWPALKENGVMIYSTCSYSKEEDEHIADWLMDTFSVDSLPLSIDASWGIVETQSDKHQAYGYRFFPYKVKGEGFFISCFRKLDGGSSVVKPPKKSLLQKASKNETGIIRPWLQADAPVQLWKQKEEILAFPQQLEKELLTIVDNVYVRRAGIAIGKIAGNDLVPDHALALSNIINPATVAVTLNKSAALQYLRREEVSLSIGHKGWTLVQFEHYNVGWIKVLPNRINNYYPQGWRILKRGAADSANENS